MKIVDIDVYKPQKFESEDGSLIGSCEYFETRICKLNASKTSVFVDESSFLAVTCTKGCGEIDGEKIAAGDSFFIPAGAGEIELSTKDCAELITVRIP